MQPFGEQRADLRSAIVACTMANAWRGKNEKAYRPRDFMPFMDDRPRQQTPEEMEAVLRSFAGAHNAFEKQARKRKGP